MLKKNTILFELQANGTFAGIGRLKVFIASLDTTISKLRTDETFKSRLKGLLELAKSPFIQSVIKSANIDFKMIEAVINGLMYDDVSTFSKCGCARFYNFFQAKIFCLFLRGYLNFSIDSSDNRQNN